MRIPLSAPDITEAEIEAVARVLRSGQLSLGPELQKFEAALAHHAGVPHAVAASSGTGALHLCVRALEIGQGDEVITTPFSFVASASAVAYERAIPVFVDIDSETLNIDVARIEGAITERTKAILMVHVFGRPAPVREILELAGRHDLRVIEDAAEAFGGRWAGRALGSLGDLGVYAFYPNKQITTGEGGAIVTRHHELALRASGLRNHGRDPRTPGFPSELGYNYRLADVLCTLGSEQLKRLPTIVARRRQVAHAYSERLESHPDLVLPDPQPEGEDRSWFAYVVRLGEAFEADARDRIAEGLEDRGIGCGRYFPPIHLLPFYRQTLGHGPGDFPVTECVATRTLALPFFNAITESQIDEVCDAVRELCCVVRSS